MQKLIDSPRVSNLPLSQPILSLPFQDGVPEESVNHATHFLIFFSVLAYHEANP